jgi:spermidine/putrescine transport system ATP-binding protein
MALPTVKLRNITKKFVSVRGEAPVLAVDNVDLEIEHGEFFSLLGPSGCGKTTTLRMIAGFEEPTTGEILIEGQNIAGKPPFHRPVNTVFQDYALFPHMTVWHNVAFGLEMERATRTVIQERVQKMLELVQLPNMDRRYPRQLSGGQQQRVALARALVKQPKVLLLDEPLGALDLKLRKQMQLELKHMQRGLGITFIYVTHDQEEALTMSDRIAVMNKGRVLQVGKPAEIYDRPANRFVADFIGETNFLEGLVADSSVESPVVLVSNQWPLHVAALPGALKPGDKVTVAVRPEKIELRPPTEDGVDCLSGSIAEHIFVGTDTRYVIRLEDGVDIVARVQNGVDGSAHHYTTGAPVKAFCSPQHTLILTE